MAPLIASQVRAALQAAGSPQCTCGPGVCELDQTRADYDARVGTLLPSGANAADFALVQGASLACPEVVAARFGAAGRDRILDAYADAWITDADLEAIAERRLNLVRLATQWGTVRAPGIFQSKTESRSYLPVESSTVNNSEVLRQ